MIIWALWLATSYRMCEQVCAPVSSLSYEGRLASSAPARGLDGIEPGIERIEVAHGGNRTDSPEEALAVADRVDSLLGTPWTEDGTTRPLGERDVLVVAPYNAQVALIRQTLAARGRTEVRVGTVDKFQGQQAPVTIVSLAASSPKEAARGMGFLLNRNRLVRISGLEGGELARSLLAAVAGFAGAYACVRYIPIPHGHLGDLATIAVATVAWVIPVWALLKLTGSTLPQQLRSRHT